MGKDTIILERRFVPKGTLVMRQGDPGNCAYLIQSGSVSVFTECDSKRIDLAMLELGQIFGEMALIFDDFRTASVVALEDTNLIIITRESFEQKLDRSDSTIQAIVRMMTQRMITANNAVIKKKTDILDLMETVHLIYQNVLFALPKNKQKAFQDNILPKLDEFLNAVSSFDKSSKK